MATKPPSTTKKPAKTKRKAEESIVTVVSAPDKATYSMRRKIAELEDRVATCEEVVEHNFGETLGQLISERSRAIERHTQHHDNRTLEAVFYVGIGLLLFIGIIINNSRSERYKYCAE